MSDTSPVSNLALIARLELLAEQFGTILVPMAVRDELARLRNRQARDFVEAAFADGWIRVIPLQRTIPSVVGASLHPGETAALGLALELHADWVLLDDGDARNRAAEIGLRFMGVLGVLLRAKRQGRLPSVSEEMHRLRKDAHFFIAPKLEIDLLSAAGEVRSTLPPP